MSEVGGVVGVVGVVAVGAVGVVVVVVLFDGSVVDVLSHRSSRAVRAIDFSKKKV